MKLDISDVLNELSVRSLQNYRLVVCDPENTEGASNMQRILGVLPRNKSHNLFQRTILSSEMNGIKLQ